MLNMRFDSLRQRYVSLAAGILVGTCLVMYHYNYNHNGGLVAGRLLVAGRMLVGDQNSEGHIRPRTSTKTTNIEPIPNQSITNQSTPSQFVSNTSNIDQNSNNYSSRSSRFRRQFMQWDTWQQPTFGSDLDLDDGRYLVYRCDRREQPCGGWADRLKGAMFAYLVANLTGRTFKAEFLSPACDMTRYFVPNHVNWLLPKRSKPAAKDMEKIRHIDGGDFKSTTSTRNFSLMLNPSKKYSYFLSNVDNISGLLKSQIYAHQLSWMKGLSPAEVYAAVYKRLFKLSTRLWDKLQDIIVKSLPTPRHRLVCMHVRMGTNPSIYNDVEVRNSLKNLPRMWEFMSNHSLSDLDRVFVMSDSELVLSSARSQSFRDKLVTIPGDIVHVDKAGAKSLDEMCSGFEHLLLEHHMLMNCDVLVRGHSGLSVIASVVRGTDDDLYCLQKDGGITPCLMNDFYPAFL